MLNLNKRTEYGLIALVHLVDREGEFVSAREIGEQHHLPPRLLAEALKDLGREGIVTSQRGATGGYSLGRPAQTITLGEVISALEGHPALTSCAPFGASTADGDCELTATCPIRSPLFRLREGIWRLLQGVSLHDIAKGPLAEEVLSQTTRDLTGPETPNPFDS